LELLSDCPTLRGKDSATQGCNLGAEWMKAFGPPQKVSEFAAHEMRIFSLLPDAGFTPKVIFDIGASNGTWSTLINQIFPDATFHLFEPLAAIREDYRKSLQLNATRTSFYTKLRSALVGRR
jgi:hypothetical protein